MLYQQLQTVFTELKDVPIPSEPQEFDAFLEWVNTKTQNVLSVNFEEFYQNRLDEVRVLQDAKIDVVALQDQIEQDIEKINTQYSSADNLDDYEGDILEVEDRLYAAFFGSLQDAVEGKDLTILVVSEENPYWMVVPAQQEAIIALIDSFNENFKDSGLELNEL